MSLETLARYPWHEKIWHEIELSNQAKRFHHALLLWGQVGVGKKDFAWLLAKSLFCHQQNSMACNLCQGCHCFNQQTHPDFISLEPLQGKKNINVAQIRQLQTELSLHRSAKTPRVVLIQSAEKMNVSSSNALLKSLEEPVDNTVFILVANTLSTLSATIQSRCKKLFFAPLPPKLLERYLEKEGYSCKHAALLSGSPLLAKEYLSDSNLAQRNVIIDDLLLLKSDKISPCNAVSQWRKAEDLFVLRVLYEWFSDLIKMANGVTFPYLINNERLSELTFFLKGMRKQQLFVIIDKLLILMKHISFSRQVNVALWLDDLAISIAYEE